MGRFSRSWFLFRHSLSVILQNKKLLLFPAVSGVMTLCVLVLVLLPISVLCFNGTIDWRSLVDQVNQAQKVTQANSASLGLASPTSPVTGVLTAYPWAYPLFGLLYLLSTFLAVFVNVALYSQILNALNGQPVSIRAGLRAAAGRAKAIFYWSLLAATVGLILKALEERLSFVGDWVVRMLGIGWTIASIFVIPGLVREPQQANPIEHLKASGRMLRRTWGEALIGFVGINLGGLVTLIVLLPVVLVSLWLGFGKQQFWFLALIPLSIVSIVIFGILMGVVNDVYKGALYIYATEGVIPGPFDEDEMNAAWKLKAGRKGLLG